MDLMADRIKQDKQSLWYLFEEQALRLENGPCLWFRASPGEEAQRYTYRETLDQSNRYAQFLLQNGVQPGELVGTYLMNRPEFIFNIMGSWAIGCAPAMINYNLGGAGLLHCLKVCKSKVLLVDDDAGCQERIAAVRDQIAELGMRIIVLDAATRAEISALAPTRPPNSMRQAVNGDSPIFMIFTSGTTGMPKACPFQTKRSYGLSRSTHRAAGLKPGPDGDTWYDCMPLYHGTGATVAVGALMAGLTLAIGQRFSVRNFWIDIRDSKATSFVYVGEIARYLLAAPPSPLDRAHSLKAMFGNGLRPDVFSAFQERFNVPRVVEFFNSTEGVFGLINVCSGPFTASAVGHHGALMRRMLQNVYIPVAIDHEKGDAIWRDPKTGFALRKSYDEGGEMLVAVASEKDFAGYLENPAATAKRFERDVFRAGDLYYRTGDALRRDADGRWYFLDRLGDTFRWKSENVSTAEVGAVLGQFPGVVEANVYGVTVPRHDGRAGCAALFVGGVSKNEVQNFPWPALLKHARAGLPRYAVPVFLRLVEVPTPSHNNKQNKVPLREEGVDLAKVKTGKAGPRDQILWLKPGIDAYVPFTKDDWAALVDGRVSL